MNDKEIKIGEYVRTKNGKIIKCTGFGTFRKEGQSNRVKTIISGHCHYIYDYIVKHSSNIIDLIEVGDYVNGLYIHGICDNGLEVYRYGDCHDILCADEIKSIVTKEQFKNIEHKVEE